ncbi:immunity protein YezG family protein [Thermoactinomyces sp. DSM 45892]|uniref:immunity protein YezG family protein n=1 Tax=Thermoactinomyces sp. DSM 45892 TaxID=1882753 RepID=UPI00089B8ADC|nr:immunity protein YezG family protein [Thermoactinomyces sp. DSM 45892]SDZ06500.1 conserved hypothetical protein [Thermoactinomyces sp. DSM 45892]
MHNFERNQQDIFKQMVDVIADMIPESWEQVYLYGEVIEGAQAVFFYYYPENNSQPVYSENIPELFPVSSDKYRKWRHQFINLLVELNNEFKRNEQELWTNITLHWTSQGKFKIEYNYDDLTDVSLFEQKTIWVYKHLGLHPKSITGKEVLEEYLKKQEEKK